MKVEQVTFCSHCGTACHEELVEGMPRQVCSACHTVLYEQWKVSAGARVTKKGTLLLVQRKFDPWAGCWHMPAGYVEKGEDPRLAAERETLEETGLNVRAQKVVDVYLDHDDPRGDVLVMIFDCQLQGGRLEEKAETLACGFFGAEEIPHLILAGPSAERSIGDWMKEMRDA